jgi:lysophospholipase L1-like esterase
LLALAAGLLAGCRSVPPNSLATHNSSRWTNDIAKLQSAASAKPPAANPIVFVGSSSIRLWTNLAAHFPGLPVVNRGFGGSQLADVYNYADRLILPYRPQQVVIYAGGNDLHEGKSPEIVFGDFVALVKKIRSELPSTRISFISVGVSPSRWKEAGEVRRLNSLIELWCRRHEVDFIDVVPLMLGPDGLPKADLYVDDRLHLNEKGYSLWREAVMPYLRGAPSRAAIEEKL